MNEIMACKFVFVLLCFSPLLNRLSSIATFSCLAGLQVTHQTAVREVPNSSPALAKNYVPDYQSINNDKIRTQHLKNKWNTLVMHKHVSCAENKFQVSFQFPAAQMTVEVILVRHGATQTFLQFNKHKFQVLNVPFDLQADNVLPYSPDCLDLLNRGNTTDGVYIIQPPGGAVTETWCDMENGGWTVLLRREDGSENFYREWTWYADGFGNRTGNYTCFKNAKQIKPFKPYTKTASV